MRQSRFNRILIVEPDLTGRKFLERFCQKTAVRVKAVMSAETALATHPYSYDCMFIECRLPGMDGLQLAMELRAGAADPGIVPFLVGMTGDFPQYDREKCLADGMDDFLEKPILQDDLKRVLGLS